MDLCALEASLVYLAHFQASQDYITGPYLEKSIERKKKKTSKTVMIKVGGRR